MSIIMKLEPVQNHIITAGKENSLMKQDCIIHKLITFGQNQQ